MSKEFEKILEEVLNSDTLSQVENYGYVHLKEIYTNEFGQKIKIAVYELNSKTYLIKYVDKECIRFSDITALKQ